ncbi:recombination-associated protein RdgC [Aeromonas dhakensis]|uniref:recombination-associated protein RdgC n=1 Tax=Aeromonas dhakensis TaxID=196024 RepID=UPI003985759A
MARRSALLNNFVVFKFNGSMPSLGEIKVALSRDEFQPCPKAELGPVYGWTGALTADDDNLVHGADGKILICCLVEQKKVPSEFIKSETRKKVEQKRKSGEKVGKEERAKIMADIKADAAKTAFPVSSRLSIWIDQNKKTVLIGTSSKQHLGQILPMLSSALPGVSIYQLMADSSSLADLMTTWLEPQELPMELAFDDTSESYFKSHYEDGGQAKFKQGSIQTNVVIDLINFDEKKAVSIPFIWQSRVKFKLDRELVFSAVRFTDDVYNEAGESDAEEENKDKDEDVAGEKGLLLAKASFLIFSDQMSEFTTEILEILKPVLDNTNQASLDMVG